jgi:hypothetical protein
MHWRLVGRGGPGLKILVGLKKLDTIEEEKFILII